MDVAITVTDAVESATSVAFAKMLEASFTYRRIESETLTSTQPQAILNLTSKEASGSDFIRNLSALSDDLQFHIDVQTFGSPTESSDFIVAGAPAVISKELQSVLKESLDLFSETTSREMEYNNIYPSTYSALVLRVPTLTILVNEGSVDLYRAAADEIAEIVENYE
jgi:hypothetical protein